MSVKAELVRSVLQVNPEATFSQVKDQVEKEGISEGYFNVLKCQIKKGDAPQEAKAPKARKPKAPPVPVVNIDEAIAFVQKGGGLAAVKAELARQQLLIDAFEHLMEKVKEAA